MTYKPHLFIDSGAYSAFHRGKPIELQEWIDYCLKLKTKLPEAMVVNLDVIPGPGEDTGEQSYENWRKMREAGIDALPVYHVNSDERWLRKYLRGTDYVGLGAIADMNTQRRMWALDRIWQDYFIDGDRMPKVRVHAMGVTSFPLMRRYPWFSIDSTSWLQAAMFGKIFVPHRKAGGYDYERKPYQMNVSTTSPKKGDKGIHIENLTPGLRAVLDGYIESQGFKLGSSKFVKAKDGTVEEVVIEKGLCNCYYQRCYLNTLFYSRFVRSMPWPRPFAHTRPTGLLEADKQAAPPHVPMQVPEKTTRLFYSGEIPIENYMRAHPDDYPNCGIMLTFFALRQSRVARSARRLHGMIRNRPYQERPKKGKAKDEGVERRVASETD